MAPVRQKGSNQNIGHPRQPGGFRQDLMMVKDVIEQRRLGEQEQEGKDREKDRKPVKHLIETIQDEPVKVIILRMKGGCRRMQKQREFEHQGIGKQY